MIITPNWWRPCRSRPGPDRDKVCAALVEACKTLARERGVASLHWRFTGPDQAAFLATRGFHTRIGGQYLWHNRGYRDFDDYLQLFPADNRKKVIRDRRRVRDAGVELRVVPCRDLSRADWRTFYGFYCAT